jgi:hypothetical protein
MSARKLPGARHERNSVGLERLRWTAYGAEAIIEISEARRIVTSVIPTVRVDANGVRQWYCCSYEFASGPELRALVSHLGGADALWVLDLPVVEFPEVAP